MTSPQFQSAPYNDDLGSTNEAAVPDLDCDSLVPVGGGDPESAQPVPAAQGADERTAYNAAFDVLKAGRYAESAQQFQAFLDAHPSGTYAPNALYWLGESYYVTQNYALALEQFQTLLDVQKYQVELLEEIAGKKK